MAAADPDEDIELRERHNANKGHFMRQETVPAHFGHSDVTPLDLSGHFGRQETYHGVYGRQDTQTTGQSSARKLGFRKSVKNSLSNFFLGPLPKEKEKDVDLLVEDIATKWRNRACRLHSNKVIGAQVRSDKIGSPSLDTLDIGTPLPHIRDPLRRPQRLDSCSSKGSSVFVAGNATPRIFQHQMSHMSTTSRRTMKFGGRYRRRDSVVQMVTDAMKGAVSRQTSTSSIKSQKSKKKPHRQSRSFAPNSISTYREDADPMDVFLQSSQISSGWFSHHRSPTFDSVVTSDESYLDDVFFDNPTPTAYLTPLNRSYTHGEMPPLTTQLTAENRAPSPDHLSTILEASARHSEQEHDKLKDETDSFLPKGGLKPLPKVAEGDLKPRDKLLRAAAAVKVDIEKARHSDQMERLIEAEKPIKHGWQSGRERPKPAPGTPGNDLDSYFAPPETKILDTMKEQMFDLNNANRRQLGKGFMGQVLNQQYKDDLDSEIQDQMEELDDHRPYFTYWITFVQIVVFIVAISVYGIAPIGFEETQITGEVFTTNVAIEKIYYFERDNLWIGPRTADLIHLGAKYSPCMRQDLNIEEQILNDRRLENETACCVRNDGSGCVQTAADRCSPTLSSWFKWSDTSPGSDGRVSGSVCGQDPEACIAPASKPPFVWEDDITTWPVCTKSSSSTEKHVKCEISGRPCCIGIQGECIIASPEECEFRRGYFHEEATLCSQVNCLEEICGMLPFLDPEVPNQFYRLWISLFVHAGILQLVVTVLFQFFIMRDIEKLAGWIRIAIIYIGSGIAGSLASSIFLPYHVEAGPAGSQWGMMSCLFVEVIQNWSILKHPAKALLRMGLILVFLLILGLLPFVDNYAHVIGFFTGFLLSFAFLPYITFNRFDRHGKMIGIIVCLFAAGGMFALLTVLFYEIPIYDCPSCHYFNCIPFTEKFCETMEVKVKRDYSTV